jgi:hypothetical protein
MTNGDEKSLGMPLEIARKNLRDDPQTLAIAEALGVDVETYIDRVLEYAQHPEKEPELELLDDASVAQLGPEAPSVEDVTRWLEQVEAGEVELDGRVKVAERDGYSTEAERSEVLRAQAGGEAPARRAPPVERVSRGRAEKPSGEGSVLEEQLRARQRQFKLGMDARRAGQGRRPPPKKD